MADGGERWAGEGLEMSFFFLFETLKKGDDGEGGGDVDRQSE